MKKVDELNLAGSCWNKAGLQELIFVFLERDWAVPAGIRAWANERLRLGLNDPWDAKIQEAHKLANQIEFLNHAVRVWKGEEMIIDYRQGINTYVLGTGGKVLVDGREVHEVVYVNTEEKTVKTIDIHQTGQRKAGGGSAGVSSVGYNPDDYPKEYELEHGGAPDAPLMRIIRGVVTLVPGEFTERDLRRGA